MEVFCGECSSGWLIRPLSALPAFIVELRGDIELQAWS